MSAVLDGAQFAEPPVGYQNLLRGLMISCPATGRPTDTGFELSAVSVANLPQLLVDCLECGQDHAWLIEDAFLG